MNTKYLINRKLSEVVTPKDTIIVQDSIVNIYNTFILIILRHRMKHNYSYLSYSVIFLLNIFITSPFPSMELSLIIVDMVNIPSEFVNYLNLCQN